MEHFSQRDPKWRNVKLGFSNVTIGGFGCFMTCESMLTNKWNPVEVNEILKKANAINKFGNQDQAKAAKALGLKLDGKSLLKPNFICIAETLDFDRPQTVEKEQHFFVFAPKGTYKDDGDYILDPLSYPCKWRKNNYRVRTYRLFHENKMA